MTRRRWMTLLLIVSIALNLMFVGAFIGFSFMRPDVRPITPEVSTRWLYRALGEETREGMRPLFEQHREELGRLRGDIRDAQQAFEAGLNAETYDPDQVSATLTQVRRAHEAYQRASHEHMVALLGRLSPEQRQLVSKQLYRRQGRYLKNRGDDHRREGRQKDHVGPAGSEQP
ncbi:MAG: hypothetical protein CNE99_01040 [OM182 bacterium MED-G24]|uniref:Signaling pathway modulator ZraP n=1 Tax=OM182 bacterium MED-G24 TaxID=1986255 RepID=A0A2A5X0V7_9GAMM|nr:MAG: hypothetical protein CNE99_01040 [OM182 bacterium MED-G24]